MTIFNEPLLTLFAKGVVLILIFLYLIFSFLIFTHARNLGDILKMSHFNISGVLSFLFLLHLLLVLSLFFIALAIL